MPDHFLLMSGFMNFDTGNINSIHADKKEKYYSKVLYTNAGIGIDPLM